MKQKEITEKEGTITQCPEFPYFGATYPDARCIDGYLWDLDSHTHNEGDMQFFSSGGERPCPFCNTEAFMQECEDNEENMNDVRKWMEEIKKKYS